MTDGAPAIALVLERTLAAPPERVFRAWTEPRRTRPLVRPRSGLPTEAEVDLRVGGGYRIRMGRWEVVGAYVAIDPPRTLRFTWRWASGSDAGETLVTVSLAPAGTARASRCATSASPARRRARNTGGSTRSLARLVERAPSTTEGDDARA